MKIYHPQTPSALHSTSLQFRHTTDITICFPELVVWQRQSRRVTLIIESAFPGETPRRKSQRALWCTSEVHKCWLWSSYQLGPQHYLCFLAERVWRISLNRSCSLREEVGPCTSACPDRWRSASFLHLLRQTVQIKEGDEPWWWEQRGERLNVYDVVLMCEILNKGRGSKGKVQKKERPFTKYCTFASIKCHGWA